MKKLILPLLVCFSFLAFGQTVDTAQVRVEIDSLIDITTSLLEEQKYEAAHQVMQQAEQKCLDAFGKETALFGTVMTQKAIIFRIQGNLKKAESLMLEVKSILEKVLGKEHLDYAKSLNNLAVLYKKMGNYEKAEPLYLEAKSIHEKELGKEHPDYAKNLNNLANMYRDMGNYEKSESLYLESKEIWEKVIGKDHPDYVWSLNGLGLLYNLMGNYEKSEAFYLKAIEVGEKIWGKEHPSYAGILYNFGDLYIRISKYEKALTLTLEAKAINEKVLGKEDPDYASCLNSLGLIYTHKGQYEKAEPMYLEVIEVWEKVWGKEHPYYPSFLLNLSTLYMEMGQYEKAKTFGFESREITEKLYGKKHPNYAINLYNLGNIYLYMRQYEKAEPMYLEAKEVGEIVLGKEHSFYAECLYHLGYLYKAMGQYEKAETLLLESKETLILVLGYDNAHYAVTLRTLSDLYMVMGQYEKAEPMLVEAATIMENELGEEHLGHATSLNQLSELYMAMGQYNKAETLQLEAMTIWEKVLGKENDEYGSCLINLGLVYTHKGQYKKAETLILEGIAICEKILGKEYPHYAAALMMLSDMYMAIGQYEKAKAFYLEANEIRKLLLIKASQHLSERELLTYTNTFIRNQTQILSFASNQKEISGSAYNNSLFYKGYLQNTNQHLSHLALADSTSKELFYQLKAYHRRLAIEFTKPFSERNNIPSLEEKANQLEKKLVRTLAGYGDAIRQVTWQEVQATLQPKAAAIEFIHYRYSNPDPTDSTLYAALVLRPDDEQPHFIPLCDEQQLQQLLSGKNQTATITQAYGSRGLTPGKKQKLKGLYDLIWQPMDSLLAGVSKVYYSPSGLLHRINLNAIPMEKKGILSDRHELVRLNSTRSLVIPNTIQDSDTKEAVLYGGINYQLDTLSFSNEKDTLDLLETSTNELSFTYTDRSLDQRGTNWDYLEGTQEEVTAINNLLQASNISSTLLSGKVADEASFKAIGTEAASPRILHLATHGFFFPDPVDTLNNRQLSLSDQEPVFKISDHPMIRSGLILAGANYAWEKGKPYRLDMEDGILTAYEISQMNLANTELVVLSACETGLGDIEGNEGVYGLQRAFKIAGAKYLLMSLWQVPDLQTKELMTTFYQKWLKEKMEIPAAFQAAQKEMQQKYEDPYKWAGFVLIQ